MRKDLVYYITLDSYDVLMQLASDKEYEIYTIEGTLADSFMIEDNETIRVGNTKPRKHIIVETLPKNMWESDIKMTLTDNDELAKEFYRRWEEFQDYMEESIG